MICDKCGNFVSTDSKFCTVCGNPMNNGVTVNKEEVSPVPQNNNQINNNNMLFSNPINNTNQPNSMNTNEANNMVFNSATNNDNDIIGDDGSYTGYENMQVINEQPVNNIPVPNQNTIRPASENKIQYGFDDHGRPLSEVNNSINPEPQMQMQTGKPDRMWTKILGGVIIILIVLIIIVGIFNKLNINSQANVSKIDVNGQSVASYTKIVEGKSLLNLEEDDKSNKSDEMIEYNVSKTYTYNSIKQDDAEMYSDYLYNMEGFHILASSYLDTILLGKKVDEYNGFYVQISYGKDNPRGMEIKYSFRNLNLVPTLNVKHFSNSTIIGNTNYGYIDCPKTYTKDETNKDMLAYIDETKQKAIGMMSINSTKTNKNYILELKDKYVKKYKNVSDIEEYKSSNLTEFLTFNGFDEEKDLYFRIFTRKVDNKIIVIILTSNKKNDELLDYAHSYTP